MFTERDKELSYQGGHFIQNLQILMKIKCKQTVNFLKQQNLFDE